MKLISLLPILAAVAAVNLPVSAQAKDKHDKHDSHHHGHDNHGSHNRYYGGSSVVTRPSLGYGYGYGYGSSYYGRSPYYSSYYSRPSFGFSYYSRPATVYRARPVYGSYSDSLAVDVQRELRRHGYYRGPIDGDIGPGSRAAIRSYQDDRGLSATGRIDSSLLRSLGIG